MARKKSEFLSGFGVAMEIFKAITDAVLRRGGSDDNLKRVVTDRGLCDQIAALIVGDKEKVAATPPVSHIIATYRYTIRRSQTLAAQIAAGKYDWENPEINDRNFPQTESEKDEEAEGALFHFGRPMTSEEVIAKMAEEGYVPEELPALLALGAAQPELQRQYPIIAISPHGRRRVPCLDGSSGRRSLDLCWCADEWSGSCRFLGRRK